MTSRQAFNTCVQLRQALQVLFINCAAVADRERVKVVGVTGVGSKCRGFWYDIKVVETGGWDALDLIHEIEKIVPNVKVTEAITHFFSRSILCIAKELGKVGTYEFNFVLIKA